MPRVCVVPLGEPLSSEGQESVARIPGATVVADHAGHDADYLLFTEPGDVLVPATVAAMATALDRSGSDAAVATGGEVVAAGLADRATGTCVTDAPGLVEHAPIAAALWRRSWWEAEALAWPQQQLRWRATLLRALLCAHRVDVVPDAACRAQLPRPAARRFRRALRSPEIGGFADALAELIELGGQVPGPARERWATAVLEPELRMAVGALPEAGLDVAHRVVALIAQAVTRFPEAVAAVPVVQRLQYHLATRRMLVELVACVHLEHNGELAARRARTHDGVLYADYPHRDDPQFPDELFRLDDEVVIRGRVERSWWEGRRLHLEGFAYLTYHDLTEWGADRLQLTLVRGSDGRELELPVERVRRPDIATEAREAAYRYEWSGFRTQIDVAALRDADGWQSGVWRLHAELEHSGTRRRRALVQAGTGAVAFPQPLEVDDVRVVPVNGRGNVVVEVDRVPAVLTEATADGEALRLRVRLRDRVARGPVSLVLQRPWGAETLVLPARVRGLRRHRVEASLPLEAVRACHVTGIEQRWTLRLGLPGGATPAVRTGVSFAPLAVGGDPEVELGSTPHRRAQVTLRPATAVVTTARWDGDALVLAGRLPRVPGRLVLRTRNTGVSHPLPAESDGERFECRITPAAMPSLAGALPLTHGTWLPRLQLDAGGQRPVVADESLLSRLPLPHRVGVKSFTVDEQDRVLTLAVGPDLDLDERGAHNQLRLRRVEFPAFVRQGLRDDVLFESYESRAYGDNARAILEELQRRDTDLRVRWVTVDGQTDLPPGIEAVRRGSRAYLQALARARYVIVPNYRPMQEWYEAPPGQTVVQTWHGAPFKRIGLHNERGQAFTPRDYTELMRRESNGWAYLLSPNPPSTPILREAFAYDGPMLETGYPRTDVFHSPDAPLLAERVRARLGLPAGKKVVLYAPTLRDDLNYGGNRYGLDLQLDLDLARRELGDDHVLLIRRHAKVVDAVRGIDGDFARDVTLWPDVNELLLAVDVLVSDYSSLMFDFANTGRPMLFFTYDLADYRDRLRGFYWDPAQLLPGPHLFTSAEVVSAIREADRLRAEYDTKYRDFLARFCPWDDGKAAARFVDQVFALHLR